MNSSRFAALLLATLILLPRPAAGLSGVPFGSDGAVAADTVLVPEPPPHRLVQDELFTLDVGARIQVRYTHAFPEEGDSDGSFRIRRARLDLAGEAYRLFDYRIQLELAGSNARLLDATIAHTFAPGATLTLGQTKAPFGRQQLISSTRLQLVDRSIVDGRFSAGRQLGALLSGVLGDDLLQYGVGVYNGEGINVTNQDGHFMQVARLAWTPLGSYSLAESALDYPDTPRLSLGIAGLNSTEEGADPLDPGVVHEVDVRRLGLEGAFKFRGFNAMSELYLEQREPEDGETLDSTGWYAQLGYLLPGAGYELAGRYASIDPEVEQSGSPRRTELALGVSRYLEGHSAKVQADVVRIDDETVDASETAVRAQLQVAF